MMSYSTNGHSQSQRASETRLIEIDLSDLGLSADLSDVDQLANVISLVYERFVPYADEGWEWISFPGSREFDGWVTSEDARARILLAVRVLSRRAPNADFAPGSRPTHGLSAYRTCQLTGRPWTAEPGSKLLRPFN